MMDIVIGLICLAILGLAVGYIVREKKRGVKCIGCSGCGTTGNNATHQREGCSGGCSGCSGQCHLE